VKNKYVVVDPGSSIIVTEDFYDEIKKLKELNKTSRLVIILFSVRCLKIKEKNNEVELLDTKEEKTKKKQKIMNSKNCYCNYNLEQSCGRKKFTNVLINLQRRTNIKYK
jgi:hypothetical protein